LENIIKWNIYVVQGQPIQPAFAVFQQIWGRRPNPPAITMMFVAGLANPEFLVEMDAIAVLPE
jgi:enamine deaminase RidA (YjgF/YER057c/UK114 family)